MPDRLRSLISLDRSAAPPSSWLAAGLALCVLVGVVARFVTTSPLWLDEALSVNIASLPLGDIGGALERDGHPPLYYWLLHGWMSVVGDGDVAARALSGVLSVATLPLAWRAGVGTAGRAGGAWAVAVLALSPYSVRYATEARMYALVMFLVLAGYLVVRRLLTSARLPDAVLLALVTGALLWTHYWSLYLAAATGGLLLARFWRVPSRRRATGTAIVALAVGGLLFLPWVPSLLEQAAHTGTPWDLPARPTRIVALTLTDLGGGGFAESQLLGTTVAVVLVLAAFARRAASGAVELGSTVVPAVRDELLVIGATLLIGAAAGYATDSAFASRYAAVVVPLILLVVAVGLSRLRWGWFLAGLAASLLGLGIVGVVHNVDDARTQADELGAAIQADAGPRDVVVACPDQLAPSLERALRGGDAGPPVVPYPLGGDPRFVDWRDYAERNAAADPAAFADAVLERAGRGTVWVVWNGTYRTLSGQCEAVIDRLGAHRAGTIVATPGDAYEPAGLFRFG